MKLLLIQLLYRFLKALGEPDFRNLKYPQIYAVVVSREKLADCSVNYHRIRARVIEEDSKGNDVRFVTYRPVHAEKIKYSAPNRNLS